MGKDYKGYLMLRTDKESIKHEVRGSKSVLLSLQEKKKTDET